MAGVSGVNKDMYRVYVRGQPEASLFTRPLIWTLLHEEGKMYTTILRDTDIVDMVKLANRAIAVVPFSEMITGDEAGLIDVWPDRVKDGEKFVVPTRWKNYTVSGMRREMQKYFPVEQWGAHCYWGKPALRVRVPKEHYAGFSKLARGMGLQFERDGPSPISTAILKVRNVSGTQDGFVLAVHKAQLDIEARYPGMAWGRGEATVTETTAIAYVTQVLTVSDHHTSLEDGYRVVFTPSVAQPPTTKAEVAAIAKSIKDVAEDVLCEEKAENYQLRENRCSEEQQQVIIALEIGLLNESLASARNAVKKAERAWRPLNLPSETVIATVDVLAEEAKILRAGKEHDRIEQFAAWVNRCPTPAEICKDIPLPEHSPALARLKALLGGILPPTKPKVLSELAASSGDANSVKRTFAQAAAASKRVGTKTARGRSRSVRA
jgi:hypothetical protein